MKMILKALRDDDGAIVGTSIAIIMLVLAYIFLMPRIDNWAQEQESVTATIPVGMAVHSRFESSLLSKRSHVETTNGQFVVKEPFQLVKDNELVINQLKSGSRYLLR